MDWISTVLRVTRSRTWLSNWAFKHMKWQKKIQVKFKSLWNNYVFSFFNVLTNLMKIMATSFKRSHAVPHSVPQPCSRPLQTRASARDSWTLTGKASLGQSLVESLPLSPGFWCTQGFVCALQKSVSPVLCKFYNQIPLPSKVKFPGSSQSLCQIHRLGNLLWVLELC